METVFLHHLSEWQWLVYIVIFLCMLIEGEAVLFISTYLAHQGYLNIFFLIPIFFCGVFVGDTLWYRFGLELEIIIPFMKKHIEKVAKPVDRYLTTRPYHTIFIARYAYGFLRATLLRAGALKIPYKKFIAIDMFSAACWIGLIGGLGFVSSSFFNFLKHYLKFLEIGVVLALVVFYVIMYFVSSVAAPKGDK